MKQKHLRQLLLTTAALSLVFVAKPAAAFSITMELFSSPRIEVSLVDWGDRSAKGFLGTIDFTSYGTRSLLPGLTEHRDTYVPPGGHDPVVDDYCTSGSDPTHLPCAWITTVKLAGVFQAPMTRIADAVLGDGINWATYQSTLDQGQTLSIMIPVPEGLTAAETTVTCWVSVTVAGQSYNGGFGEHCKVTK